MKRFLLPMFMLICMHSSYSQIIFETTYGNGQEGGVSVIQTTDSGYVLYGVSRSQGFGMADYYLVKTNPVGDTLWTRTFGTDQDEIATSFAALDDGGFILCGYHFIPQLSAHGIYLVRTDQHGDTLWTRNVVDSGDVYGYSLALTPQGGFAITGYRRTPGGGDQTLYLVITDSAGNTLWKKDYGGAQLDHGHWITRTADNGYVITGYTLSFSVLSSYHVYLIKVTADGTLSWSKTFGGQEDSRGNCVAQTPDGGYIVTGFTSTYGAGGHDLYLVRTNADGDSLWTKTYGGVYYDEGNHLCTTTDGGFVITGQTYSFSESGSSEVYLVKTDANGDSLWTKRYGGFTGRTVAQTSDSGFIITGNVVVLSSTNAYLIKTDPAGNTQGSLGIESFDTIQNETLGIHPNPASRQIHLRLPASFGSVEQIRIFNVSGQLQAFSDGSSSSLDVSRWPSGLYFILLTNTKGQMLNSRFVVSGHY